MLPTIRTAWHEDFERTGNSTFYVGCDAFSPVRALAHVVNGRCESVTIHGLGGVTVCYTLDIPGRISSSEG